MAPSAALQSRINAFENLESANHQGNPKLKGSVRLEPLSLLPHKPVQQHILDSDCTSPTADALCSIPPIQPIPPSPSSPAALGRKSSLIDFSELPSPPFKPVSADGRASTTPSSSSSESSKKPQLPPRGPQFPPLPPRKPSVTSLKVNPSTTPIAIPPPLPKRHASSPVSLPMSNASNNSSLLNAPDSHTYPPASPRRGVSPGFQSRHMPSSSTSSFHSVSLSSDGGDTKESLDGSYETVNSTAATSPTVSIQNDWEQGSSATPKVPQSQRQKQTTKPIVQSSSGIVRRPPPPPPQRWQTKPPSIQPSGHHRPAPLPPDAKRRYDALFERNMPQTSRKGRASGWRGLSVDLLTNGENSDFIHEPSGAERLDGQLIKCIWSCSRLPRKRLREIW